MAFIMGILMPFVLNMVTMVVMLAMGAAGMVVSGVMSLASLGFLNKDDSCGEGSEHQKEDTSTYSIGLDGWVEVECQRPARRKPEDGAPPEQQKEEIPARPDWKAKGCLLHHHPRFSAEILQHDRPITTKRPTARKRMNRLEKAAP